MEHSARSRQQQFEPRLRETKKGAPRFFLGELVAASDTGRLQFFGDHTHLAKSQGFINALNHGAARPTALGRLRSILYRAEIGRSGW
jgi:hypothetical protein